MVSESVWAEAPGGTSKSSNAQRVARRTALPDTFQERGARHFDRLGQPHQSQRGWCHICQAAIAQACDMGRRVDQDGSDRAAGVGGVGLIAVTHLFGITVIGADQQPAAGCGNGFGEPSQASIDALGGNHGGFQIAGMADHVAIGVVDHHQTETADISGLRS